MSETKDKIVALADKLVRTKGFNDFSYKDIAVPLDIKNAAVHYHFPSKTDLGVTVVDAETNSFHHNAEKWAKLPEDQQLKNLCEVFNKHCRAGNVCLMGSLAPDFFTFEEPLQRKVEQMAKDILEWLTNCLENGRKKKYFSFNGSAENRALLIITNLQSGLLLSRVLGPDKFTRITRQLLDDILP
ncbi:TetR/AcrR family transcriptional regulator [Chitinophaga sp. Cy-1792]|uniref:TetR/AcrR family transcriptional regulator n=1 Tax=Chitinophaga sp. Cy-1792 TaxID=2608339 RepID=UPI001423624E|nr:TetR/AcrR family transcriptional regulator [Chitinophaga sp. Cy-1792]NIG53925.1 TetR/AcrR family transcriptional regulator [Chitinophaga sp. Cy-1792]